MVFTWIIKHLTLFFNFLIFYNIFMVSLDKIMLEIKTKISNKKDIVPKSKKKNEITWLILNPQQFLFWYKNLFCLFSTS